MRLHGSHDISIRKCHFENLDSRFVLPKAVTKLALTKYKSIYEAIPTRKRSVLIPFVRVWSRWGCSAIFSYDCQTWADHIILYTCPKISSIPRMYEISKKIMLGENFCFQVATQCFDPTVYFRQQMRPRNLLILQWLLLVCFCFFLKGNFKECSV